MGGQFSKDATIGGWLASFVPACLLPAAASPDAEAEAEAELSTTTPTAEPPAAAAAPDAAAAAAVAAPSAPPPPLPSPSASAPASASVLLRALWRKHLQQQQQPQEPGHKTAEDVDVPKAPPPSPATPTVVDPADLLLKGLVGQTVIKTPGSLGGGGGDGGGRGPQPFAIEACRGCDIYVLDATAQVTVDDCADCRIVLGPCAGSLFLRDSQRCAVVAACQQFRTRGCSELDVWLYAATAPSIEASYGLRLACYSYAYDGLAAQFPAAGLDPQGENRWWDVYDFTPEAEPRDTPHFCLLVTTEGEGAGHAARIKPLPVEVATQIGYTEDPTCRIVPLTKPPSSA